MFADVCAIAARVLPHDEAHLVLQMPGLDDVNVFVRRDTESLVAGLSRPDPSPGEDFVEAGVFRVSLPSGGVGSGVRATVRPDSTTAGVFMLLSNTPRQYTECDVLFVQLAADQIASMLVRQQLTALTHDAALERERAANLEASEQMLQALASVLDGALPFRMELIESRAGNLPVVLLVQVAQRDRVCQQLVETFQAFLADVLTQRYRQLDQVTVRMDLVRLLMDHGLCSLQNRVGVELLFRHAR